MRYGVFSDVHSNRPALEAVLAALQSERVDRLLCAGDLVGYAAEPAACVEQVRAAAHAVVAGNHDWAVAGRFDAAWFHHDARAALAWTTDHLSAAAAQYLAGLPLTWQDESVTLAHGTLHEPEQFHYLLDADAAARSLALQTTPVAFVGHTHVPVAFAVDADGDVQCLRGPRVEVQRGRRYLVNVGSVGQPRDQDPRACYVVYDTARRLVEFTRVPYPVARTQAAIRAAGLPARCADRLARGG